MANYLFHLQSLPQDASLTTSTRPTALLSWTHAISLVCVSSIYDILMPNPHNWSDLKMVQLIHSLPNPTPLAPPHLMSVQSDTSNPDCLLINGSRVLGLPRVRMGLSILGRPIPGTMIT